jgi:hypothetical protein
MSWCDFVEEKDDQSGRDCALLKVNTNDLAKGESQGHCAGADNVRQSHHDIQSHE